MAIINRGLQNDRILLTIDTVKNTVAIQNIDPIKTGLFNVKNAAVLNGQPVGDVIVWSYQQGPLTSATIPIPAVDNNGGPINWVVQNVTNPKTGLVSQEIVSPQWQLTMV